MIWLWTGFTVIVLALLALDLGVLNRKPHEIGLREATLWTAMWIVIGVAFSGLVYVVYGRGLFGAVVHEGGQEVVGGGWQATMQYLTGYVLEKSLSIDNIFVMAVLMKSFAVESRYQHRVLYYGILGAIVTRGLMIFGGVWLVTRFSWLFYVFGAYLAYAGVKMLFPEKHGEVGDRWYIRAARRMMPLHTGEHGGRFFVRHDGRLHISMLLLAVIAIEFTDVVFAVDSVPAVLSITTDAFIVMTSNVFAILGLRSLYFVLAHMLKRFELLKYSIATILVFIGAKMVLHETFKVPTVLSLVILLGLLSIGVVASLLRRRPEP